MKVWKGVRRFVVVAVRFVAFFVFAFGIGVIFAVNNYPDISGFVSTGGLAFQQFFSKRATGNWFPMRFEHSGVLRYDAARAHPGYTLYTLAPDLSTHLVDMNGREVHRWFVPQETVMPGTARQARTLFGLLEPQIEGGHLFPNGDVLLVYELKALGVPATPLVKLNKDSQILWRSEVKAHHALQVVGDKIYVLTGTFNQSSAKPVVPSLGHRPYFGERVSILDTGGDCKYKEHAAGGSGALQSSRRCAALELVGCSQRAECAFHSRRQGGGRSALLQAPEYVGGHGFGQRYHRVGLAGQLARAARCQVAR
jgi:hypothetical protein